MANERLTEAIVRDHFKKDPLFSSIRFEEQKSANKRITDCLAEASKSLTGKPGRPEFIITFPSQSMEYLIVIECKADVSKHRSVKKDKPKEFAVDGALHYSGYLSKEFHVLSIAVSGESIDELVISQFLQRKGEKKVVELKDDKLLSIYDYAHAFQNEQFAYNLKDVNIVEKAIILNDKFQKCSISEGMRNTMVSGILLALQDDVFKVSYPIAESSQEIADYLLNAVKKVLSEALKDSGQETKDSKIKAM